MPAHEIEGFEGIHNRRQILNSMHTSPLFSFVSARINFKRSKEDRTIAHYQNQYARTVFLFTVGPDVDSGRRYIWNGNETQIEWKLVELIEAETKYIIERYNSRLFSIRDINWRTHKQKTNVIIAHTTCSLFRFVRNENSVIDTWIYLQ